MALQNQFPQAALSWRWFWLSLGWLLVFFVVFLSLTPVPVELPVEQGDKFGHVLAYVAMMSWFANLYEAPTKRLQFAVGFIALGISLEYVQRWTGYRNFEYADMVADATGVAIGWFFAPPRTLNYLRGMEKVFRRT